MAEFGKLDILLTFCSYHQITGKDVPIGIRVVIAGQDDESVEMMKSPTKTTGDILRYLKRQYNRDFKITRDGKELEDNLTLAQAAQTGSTVNWIAQES